MEVEYQNLTVEADALMGSSRNPSVWNAAKDLMYSLLPSRIIGQSQKMPVKLLEGVDGVLKPGRLTLLLGPPGSGKSVLLQALSGRLRAHEGLRIDGSIKYNGEDVDEFVVQRTAGYVDQHDKHIHNMTVLETVNFAAQC